jgi:hypothetical protein
MRDIETWVLSKLKAKQRTKANKITTLKWPDGSLCTLQGELKSLAANIYQ